LVTIILIFRHLRKQVIGQSQWNLTFHIFPHHKNSHSATPYPDYFVIAYNIRGITGCNHSVIPDQGTSRQNPNKEKRPKEKNMDELVNMIAKKTGLSTEMSKTVVTMVLDFVKQKLPAPIASQVDAAIAGGGSSVASALGGLFGNK
jgi:hypothetical protein